VLIAREAAKGVAIVYHPEEQKDAENAKKLIEKEGSQALLIPQDLSEGEQAAKRVVDEVVNAWGGVDILVGADTVSSVLVISPVTFSDALAMKYSFDFFFYNYLSRSTMRPFSTSSTP